MTASSYTYPRMKNAIFSGLLVILSIHSGQCLTVRVLAWDDTVAGRDLVLSHPKGSEKLNDMHPFQRTRELDVTTAGETPPVILAMDKKDKDGVPASVLISFPASVKRALVLLLPDANDPSGIRPLAIPDDVSSFPWGSIRFVNTTGRELVVTWEKKLVALPTAWTPIDIKPGGENRNMEVKVFLRSDPKTAIYSAVWEHREEFRSLVFISASADETQGFVEFKFINEDKRVADLEARQAGGE